ncbi:mannose-specific lectin-like [Magnolia sinica]|uniref:mannose-specific lectin-like n=1 Tax=Magnolia sinica TaxID=86752 RepID=UPI00265AF99C|nr:mannose-specific lectin-like [Magnolia sinica]
MALPALQLLDRLPKPVLRLPDPALHRAVGAILHMGWQHHLIRDYSCQSIYKSTAYNHILLTPACKVDNILYPGETLSTNNNLEYGSYSFIIQEDCNLVLYDNGNPIWASNTGRLARNCHCTMQTDGNLVVYDPNGVAIWASNTTRDEGFYILILQKDRNVVIYGGATWATATNAYGSNAMTVVTVVSAPKTNCTALV